MEQNEQLNKAILAIQKLKSELDHYKSDEVNSIAILGMACRLPGHSNDLSTFWNLLVEGKQALEKIPDDRWNHEAYYSQNQNTPGKYYTTNGNFLDDVRGFDRLFFDISKAEAKAMDPHHRLILMVAWEALQNAYIPPSELKGKKIGVFLGMGSDKNDSLIKQAMHLELVNSFSGIGASIAGASGRISYLLNSKGPSITVDTGSSSSLTALHYAVQSLKAKDCDIAIIGGVSLMLSPLVYVILSQMGVLSQDGYTRGFDQEASGFGRGEGAGIIILKRHKDAREAGDNILAVIKGTSTNFNTESMSLSSPSQIAQELLLQECLGKAGLSADDISYIEAQGTASPVGDFLELAAIQTIYGKKRTRPCYIASAESNLGHLDAASGIARLIKVVLAMQHEQIPAHLNFVSLNKNINLSNTQLFIADKNLAWPKSEHSRNAAVSAFGWTGQNAHVILQDYQEHFKTYLIDTPPYLLPISAKSVEAFQLLLKQYTEFIKKNPTRISDICRLASIGRERYVISHAFIAKTVEEVIASMENYQYESTLIDKGNICFIVPKKVYSLDNIKELGYGIDFSNDTTEHALIRLWTLWLDPPDKLMDTVDIMSVNYNIELSDKIEEIKYTLYNLYNAGKKINFNYIYKNRECPEFLDLPKHPWINENY